VFSVLPVREPDLPSGSAGVFRSRPMGRNRKSVRLYVMSWLLSPPVVPGVV